MIFDGICIMKVIHMFEGTKFEPQLNEEIMGLKSSADYIAITANYLWLIVWLLQEKRASRLVSCVWCRYFYIVKGSLTTDSDVMMHEVKNYKLQIPPFIQVWTVCERFQIAGSRWSFSELVGVFKCRVWEGSKSDHRSLERCVEYRAFLSCFFSFFIFVDPYVEEGRANALLIHFLSTLLNIPNISCSLMYKNSKLAMKIEDIDYEDLFVKLQAVMLK